MDGITEEIITTLSKVSKLFVIAHNSTLAYKDRGVNGGVKTSHVAAQKSTTSGYLERAMETG